MRHKCILRESSNVQCHKKCIVSCERHFFLLCEGESRFVTLKVLNKVLRWHNGVSTASSYLEWLGFRLYLLEATRHDGKPAFPAPLHNCMFTCILSVYFKLLKSSDVTGLRSDILVMWLIVEMTSSLDLKISVNTFNLLFTFPSETSSQYFIAPRRSVDALHLA